MPHDPSNHEEHDRQQYLDRHMLGDIGRAQAGQDPDAARRLLAFFVSEVDAGRTLPVQLLQYVAGAASAAEKAFAKVHAAFERGAPASGAKRPTFDINRHLGLSRATVGAPPQDDGVLEEAVDECLDDVMRGRSREVAERDAADAAGRSVSLIRKRADKARQERWFDIAMQVLQRANAALAAEGIEFSRQPDEVNEAEEYATAGNDPAWHERRKKLAATSVRCREAKEAAVLVVAAETGMQPTAVRRAMNALWRMLDGIEDEDRRQER